MRFLVALFILVLPLHAYDAGTPAPKATVETKFRKITVKVNDESTDALFIEGTEVFLKDDKNLFVTRGKIPKSKELTLVMHKTATKHIVFEIAAVGTFGIHYNAREIINIPRYIPYIPADGILQVDIARVGTGYNVSPHWVNANIG